jgi:uncharacterized protein (DUF58 family)
MMVVPGREAVVVTAVAAFLFFAAANLQAGWMYAIDAILIGMLAAGVLSAAWSVRGLRIDRSVTAEIHEGDAAAVVLTLRTRRLPRFFLEIVDEVPGLPAHREMVPAVWPGQNVEIRYAATARRRGVYGGGAVTVQSSGLTGWFRATRAVMLSSPLTVFPRLWPLGTPRLPGLEERSEPTPSTQIRAGLEVSGVRNYRSGDSMRHVHWRSTARRGHLVIREYDRDGHDAAVLLLDARARGGRAGASPEIFEDLIRAVASVADALSRNGHPVRVAAGAAGIPVTAGPDRTELMRWLAAVRDDGSMAPAAVYEALCAPGTPVILVTTDPGSVGYFAAAGIPRATLVAGDGDDVRERLRALA